MKKVVISGASGFVGMRLQSYFSSLGFEVIPIMREELQDVNILCQIIDGASFVVNLSGANIVSRWSESYKKILYSSRINTTKNLVLAMKQAKNKPKLFISTSAVGIYSNNDFLVSLVQDWESEALKANSFGVRTTILRFGIVLGKDGGALQKMLLPFKLGLGGTIGSGKQPFSFIHIEDLLSTYKFILEHEHLDGVFNLTAPHPTTNYGLTKALGKALKRPTILPVPEFVLRLIFGEGAQVLTEGQSVVPKKLLDNGFKFKYKTIEDAIESLFP